jgi:hypothetical protein
MDTKAKFETVGTSTEDNLIAGNAHLLVGRKITIVSGQGVLVRGTVLGKVTASGKYVKSLSASSDGSQTPDLILAQDVDATSADAQALAYARGDFAAQALTLGTAHTVASITEGLRAKGITIINMID